MYNLQNALEFNESPLTLEAIRDLTDEYKLFAFYIGQDFKLNEAMQSPLRKDKNPSFSVFNGREGVLIYKDFATGDSGDIAKFIMKMFTVSFRGALEMIDRDFELGLSSGSKNLPLREGFKSNLDVSTVETVPRSSNIGVKRQEFTSADEQYWRQYGIDTTCLKKYNVFSIKFLFINGNKVAHYSYNNPMYAYIFLKDNKVTYKIYRPLDKEYKWSSNTDRTVLQGWDQLPSTGDTLIITKSLKDVMVFHQMGYPSVAMQNEVSSIKDTVIEELKSRFKKIYILQDFDYAGVSGSNKLRKLYGITPFFIQSFRTRSNGLKDISDYVQAKGMESAYQMIFTILNEL
jgi:hypothetical protein